MQVISTKNVPVNYVHQKTLDLSNHKLLLILNIFAIGMLFPVIYIFVNIVKKIRPEFTKISTLTTTLSPVNIFSIILVVLIAILIHELIHGVFFWLFTGERPHFAFKILYAYAAAPEWYIPKTKFIIIGISPVILISCCVILLSMLFPPILVLHLLIAGVFNFVGSTGDIFVIAWLLLLPKDSLVNDLGDSFRVYIEKQNLHSLD